MRPIAILSLVVVLLLAVLATTALADVLHLKNGSTFEGKVVKETATHVHFKIRGLGEQAFKKSEIEKIEKTASVFDQYEERKKALAKNDAAGHFELGLWCAENDLRKEAKKEFQAAVAADAEHAGAREKLGYLKYEGEWVTKKRYDELMAELAVVEGEILESFELGDPHEDEEILMKIGAPKGWEKDALPGAVTFQGPELGKAPVVIHYEISDLQDDLDEFIATTTKTLKRRHEGIEAVGEPTDSMLAGAKAKMLAFTYPTENGPMERREILSIGPAGGHRLYLECRAGYYAKLKSFFGKVAISLKAMSKPADLTSKEGGFSLTFPDENYQKLDTIPFTFGEQPADLPEGLAVVAATTSQQPTFFVVVAGKKDDQKFDASSLESLKQGVLGVMGAQGPQMMAHSGTERTLTVAGQEAKAGDLIIGPEGAMGSGHWAVFMKGDRYFMCVFINFLNGMGPGYAKTDFNKFLAGFLVLD